jgi:acyl-CoA reductase-like NAD-dependent aldehyde dehydrogenase
MAKTMLRCMLLQPPAGFEKGNFLGPTILTDVDTKNIAYTEEIFAPVLVRNLL